MRIPTTDLRYRDDLLDICHASQGEYLDAWHPPTSWATRYSNKFVEAIAALYGLYRANGFEDPHFEILALLEERGVRACRGGVITAVQLKYVFEQYQIPVLSRRIGRLKLD
jgi:hypothetical protein